MKEEIQTREAISVAVTFGLVAQTPTKHFSANTFIAPYFTLFAPIFCRSAIWDIFALYLVQI